jgi:hypothetical protein
MTVKIPSALVKRAPVASVREVSLGRVGNGYTEEVNKILTLPGSFLTFSLTGFSTVRVSMSN